MKNTLDGFRRLAMELEDKGVDISVCDTCESTYPVDWILNDGTCPYCNGMHTMPEIKQENKLMQVTKEQLQELINKNISETGSSIIDGFILLEGNIRSSKSINTNADGKCSVYSYVDDSIMFYGNTEEMLRETNIGKSLELGTFYVHNYARC